MLSSVWAGVTDVASSSPSLSPKTAKIRNNYMPRFVFYSPFTLHLILPILQLSEYPTYFFLRVHRYYLLALQAPFLILLLPRP